MKWRKKKSPYPQLRPNAGCSHIPCATQLAEDEALGVEPAFPDVPDFEEVARGLVATADEAQTFHQAGVRLFYPKLADCLEGYAAQVDSSLQAFEVELSTTYRASLIAAIDLCTSRLADYGPQGAQERFGHAAFECADANGREGLR